MNFFLLAASNGFFRFPIDNIGHWILTGVLAYGIVLLVTMGVYDEHQIEKYGRLKKTSWAYAMFFSIGILGFIMGVITASIEPSIFLVLLVIPAMIIYLTLAMRIRKKEIRFIKSDEVESAIGEDEIDPTKLIQ